MVGIITQIVLDNNTYNIVGCSIKGQDKNENQDSFDIYFDDSEIIVAVADGLGSAKQSKIGSSEVNKSLIRTFTKENQIDKKSINKIFDDWTSNIGENKDNYDTTCKFIKIDEKNVQLGGIGDGLIALIEKNEYIEFKKEHEFTNQTDSMLSFDIEKNFIINCVKTSDIKMMVISTDGFSEDIETDAGKNLLSHADECMKNDLNKFYFSLNETLLNWPVTTNCDDKTVIFIQRVKNE